MELIVFRTLALMLMLLSQVGCSGGLPAQARPSQTIMLRTEPAAAVRPQVGSRPLIQVAPRGWGSGDPATIQIVLDAVAAELMTRFGAHTLAPIRVSHSAGAPVTLYGRGPAGEYRIELSASGVEPGPYIYEFAHEFCHVLSNYDRYSHLLTTRKQQWFEEALCEVASLYSLKALSANWQRSAPNLQLAAAAPRLLQIAQEFQREAHRRLPAGWTLAEWYRSASQDLKNTAYNRDRNEVVANLLLPLFEENPELWGALRFLNLDAPAESFQQYLQSWLDRAPPRYQDVIRYTISLFFQRDQVTAQAAASFPLRPIEIIVTFGPGGGADGMARKLASLLEPRLGVPVLVSNVAGAAGNAGLTKLLLSSDPDHTLVTLIALTAAAWADGVGSVGPDDFTVLSVVQDSQSMLFVAADSPLKDFNDFLAGVKADPGHFRVATSGHGTLGDLTLALLGKAGYRSLNAPFANPQERYAAALDRSTDALFEEPGDVASYLVSGQLRPLVAFADQRQAGFPQVPAISEFGIKVGDLPNFRSLAVNSSVAAEKVVVLVEALKAALDTDEWKRYCAETYSCAAPGSSDDAKARVRDLIDRVTTYREGLSR